MRLNVIVYPNAKNERLVQEEGRSRVYLAIKTKDPNPNKALIKFLAGHFCVQKNKISIIKGEDRREKLIEIMKG
jgi:uncharacterized protein YggU (UPF0235/DUF167 family)